MFIQRKINSAFICHEFMAQTKLWIGGEFSTGLTRAALAVGIQFIFTRCIFQTLADINYLWLAPLNIAVFIYLLWSEVGMAIIPSVALMVLLSLLYMHLGWITGKMR